MTTCLVLPPPLDPVPGDTQDGGGGNQPGNVPLITGVVGKRGPTGVPPLVGGNQPGNVPVDYPRGGSLENPQGGVLRTPP